MRRMMVDTIDCVDSTEVCERLSRHSGLRSPEDTGLSTFADIYGDDYATDTI